MNFGEIQKESSGINTAIVELISKDKILNEQRQIIGFSNFNKQKSELNTEIADIIDRSTVVKICIGVNKKKPEEQEQLKKDTSTILKITKDKYTTLCNKLKTELDVPGIDIKSFNKDQKDILKKILEDADTPGDLKTKLQGHDLSGGGFRSLFEEILAF
jgi:hypothetical protein